MEELKVIYNDFELGNHNHEEEDLNNNGSLLDTAFATFQEFHPNLKVDLDMNGSNLLLPIDVS